MGRIACRVRLLVSPRVWPAEACVLTVLRQSIVILFVVYVLLWIFTARGRANAQVQLCRS